MKKALTVLSLVVFCRCYGDKIEKKTHYIENVVKIGGVDNVAIYKIKVDSIEYIVASKGVTGGLAIIKHGIK